jgi:hypothetical protein
MLNKIVMVLVLAGVSSFGFASSKKVKIAWGEKISLKKEVKLSDAVEDKSLNDGDKEFLVTGVAKKICLKKGCWMVINDKKLNTRVTFKDYGFFVDDSLIGKKVLAQGYLKQKTMTRGEVIHYLIDEGMDPIDAAKVGKKKTTFTFVASGVKIAI